MIPTCFAILLSCFSMAMAMEMEMIYSAMAEQGDEGTVDLPTHMGLRVYIYVSTYVCICMTCRLARLALGTRSPPPSLRSCFLRERERSRCPASTISRLVRPLAGNPLPWIQLGMGMQCCTVPYLVRLSPFTQID